MYITLQFFEIQGNNLLQFYEKSISYAETRTTLLNCVRHWNLSFNWTSLQP